MVEEAKAPRDRGFHSSTFQLSLRRSCHCTQMTAQHKPEKYSRQAKKSTSVCDSPRRAIFDMPLVSASRSAAMSSPRYWGLHSSTSQLNLSLLVMETTQCNPKEVLTLRWKVDEVSFVSAFRSAAMSSPIYRAIHIMPTASSTC